MDRRDVIGLLSSGQRMSINPAWQSLRFQYLNAWDYSVSVASRLEDM